MTEKRRMSHWNFDNTYTMLPDVFYKKQLPARVERPELMLLNEELGHELGLHMDALREEGAAIFSGNQIVEGSEPFAQAYAGHQFGHFTMLGDGRAVMLGEHVTPSGKRVDIQLKGAGQTPFSRRGDGRATLGPVLREYIVSEAMHGLNIPTSRALAAVGTGENVQREQMKQGAVLTRVSSSHIRVGTFEYAAYARDEALIIKLLDYTIDRHYPQLQKEKNKPLAFLREVIKKQAALVALWMKVGFVHGVMNTDNVSINGQTIDYGPCAFIDAYDRKAVFSSIDHSGRYAYGNQPAIAQWNLARLAETLIPLIHPDPQQAIHEATDLINMFPQIYDTYWYAEMGKKLGLEIVDSKERKLIDDLLHFLEGERIDYTYFFRSLTLNKRDLAIFEAASFIEWEKQWKHCLARQGVDESVIAQRMKQHNPAVIPRNYLVEKAIQKAEREADFSDIKQLLDLLQDPYAYTAEQEKYGQMPPDGDSRYITYCGT